LNVLAIAKTFNKLPSEVLSIKDEFTAYCFDEAMTFIEAKMRDGEEPHYSKKYKSFGEYIKTLDLQ
jgi:hypothetical protein